MVAKMPLLALVLALLAGGGSAWAQSPCSSVSSESGMPGVMNGFNLVSGDVISGVITGTGGEVQILQSTSPYTVLFNANTIGPFSYRVPASGVYFFTTGNTGNFTVSCSAPQTAFTVTTTADDASGVAANCATGSTNACTLRDALAAAAASTSTGLTVNFSPTVFLSTNTVAQNTITLGSGGTLNVPKNTTIQGLTTGSGASLQNLVTVSGNNNTNIFSMQSGTAAINSLTMTAGYAQGAAFGGAIFINSGTLTLNQDTISNNQATLGGGGIFNAGTLTITNSTISGNKTGSSGSGGGIYQSGGTLTISNSTIANNVTAGGGGGMYLGSGSASLTSVTVTGNSAIVGGGVYASGSVGTLSYNNSILAGNSASTAYPDTTAVYTTNGVNVLHYLGSGSSYYTAFTLALAPLGSYGGPTQTMPARPTSPAFCASTTGSGTDQRGVARPTVYTGSNCNDIGATNSLYSLVWTTEPATSYSVGQALSPAPVLQLEDDGAAFSGIGSLSLTDSTGTYSGSFETFSTSGSYSAGLTYPSTEQSVTLTASTSFSSYSGANSGTISSAATTPAFNVVNPVTGFRISTLNNVMAGTAQSVTVTALNGSGTSTSYTGTVAFSSTDHAAVLPLSYTFTAADAGVHTFALGVVFKTAGTGQTITVTDTSASVTKTSNGVTVTPAAAATVAATGTTTISLATGAAFGATALQVQVLDAYQNSVSGATVTYALPSSGPSAALGATSCTTNASGMCSVTATASSLPGTYSITASVNGIATPVTFNVTNTGPAIYTVTVATDTTTGTPGNCTEGGTTDANCSLRDALAAAAALPPSSTIPAIIQFSATNFTAATTITLAHGALTVPNQSTIQGLTTGSGASLTNLITVSGNNASTIFNLATGVTAAINNLTITAAVAHTSGGGAINNAGTLTLNQDTVSNSTANASGGGVSNYGTLTVNNSTFSGNKTVGSGSGGAIYDNGPGLLTISNSTFTGNSSGANGGALYAFRGNVTLTNTTITGNTSGIGGGVDVYAGGTYLFTMSNTIVAGNTATVSYADIGGTASAYTAGLYGTAASGTSVYTAASLGLAALGSYGGPTQTMPALPTGAAFCRGNGSGSDQRGVARPATYGLACVDYGATNSNYSLAFTTQPAASYAVNAKFTTTPVLSFEDDGFVLPFTSASTPAAFTDTNNAFGGSSAGFFNNGNATPTSGYISSVETSDKLVGEFVLTNGGYQVLSATSNSFAVVNPLTAFAISTLSNVTAGTPQSVTVTALNGSATSTGYTGTVTFSSSDSAAVLPSSYTFTTADTGVHTFTNGVTFETEAPSQTITVTDSSASVSQTSNAVTVSFPAPAVTAVSPNSGVPAGGSTVTITGTNFVSVTAVSFGSTAATSFSVNNPNTISAVVPVGIAGMTADVTVTTATGTSASVPADQYTYLGAVGSVPVGSTSDLTVQFTIPATEVLSAVKVVTQGATGLDFTDTGSGSCNEYVQLGSTLNPGNTCTVTVQFKPTAPGQRMGAVELFTSGGTTPAATLYVYGTGTGPMVTFPSNNTPISLGGGFLRPFSLAVDPNGTVYEVDSIAQTMNVIPPGCATSTCVTTIASGLNIPAGVALDGAGNLYVTLQGSSTVLEFPLGCNSSACAVNLGGGLGYIFGIAVDASGNVYVADDTANVVQKIPPGCASSSCVVALGGGFHGSPFGVAVDASGNVFVTDLYNFAVKEIPAGCTSASCVITVGGGFGYVFGVAVDGMGNVYVVDDIAGHGALKRMLPGCASANCVTTLESSPDVYYGIAVDAAGNIYLGNVSKPSVQQLPFAVPPSFVFATPTTDGTTDTTDGTKSVTVANSGNQPLSFEPTGSSNPSVSSGFTLASSTCPSIAPTGTAQMLAAGSSCTLGIQFAPLLSQYGTVQGSVAITDNALNAPGPSFTTQSISLKGTGIQPTDHLTITVPSTAYAGTPFQATITAYVDSAGTQVATGYTGPVSFTSTDPYAVLPSATTLTAGVGTVSVTLNTGGNQTITAKDASGSPSGTSAAIAVTGVDHFSFANVPSTVVGGAPFTFTVTAIDTNGNVATSYTGTVAITNSTFFGANPASSTLTNGVGTFTMSLDAGYVLSFATNPYSVTNPPVTITATDTVLSTLKGTSAGVTVTFPNLVVTTTADTTGVAANCTPQPASGTGTDAACGLRDAIAWETANNSGATISFDATHFATPQTITLTHGTLQVRFSTSVQGPGAAKLTISGNNQSSIAVIAQRLIDVSIDGVTLANAFNSSSYGAIGISSNCAFTLTNSVVKSNQAKVGGAIDATGQDLITIQNTSFLNNSATNGGALVLSTNSVAFIAGSTFSGNSATQYGGAIDSASRSLSLTDTTIANNSAGTSGGAILQSTGGTVTLNSTTLVGNTATTSGGGVYLAAAPVSIVAGNSLLAGNTSAGTEDDCSGLGTGCPVNGTNGDVVTTAALANLAPLGSYGGSTQTLPALPGSPVLCAGLVSNVGSLTTDQRGNPRIAAYAANQCVDAGAVQTAYSLAFVQQPNNTDTGLSMSPAPTVQIYDNGVAIPLAGVGLTIGATNGTLSGPNQQTTDATGLATFTGLSIGTVQTGDTLVSGTPLTLNFNLSATSNPFNVTTVTATQAIANEVLTQNQPSASFTPVTGSGGTAPLSYSIAPALPLGLGLSSTTGAISGSPSVASAATTYTVTVTDAGGVTGTATFSLTVSPAVVATQLVASTALSQNYSASFRPVSGSGGTGALSYSASPSLPAGLSLSTTNGTISGTPTATSPATTYTVTVTDSNNATATATFSLTVNTAVTATQAVASTTLVLNQPATAFTPVTGAGGTGTLSYSISPALPAGLSLSNTTGTIGGTPAATSSATTYTVMVTDQNGATATATFSLSVILSVPPTVASVSAVTTTYGATTGVTVTATETGNQGLATGGTVTFGVSGSATGSFSPATCTLSTAGTCSTTFIPTGTLPAGTYAGGITVSFAKVNSYAAASGSSTLTVTQAAQTIAFAPASPVAYGVAPITLNATGGGSGNPITYTLGTGSPATLSGNTLTVTGAGTITLTANQAANANYKSAPAVTATIVVSKATPTIALVSSVNPVLLQNAVTLTATVSGVSVPTGSVSFYDSTVGSAVGSANLVNGVASAQISSLAAGMHLITAIYSGDGNFVSIPSSAVSEQVEDFSLNVSSANGGATSLTVVPGATATYLLTISPTGSTTFPSAISLSVSGLPGGAAYTITPASIPAGGGATNVTLTITPPRTVSRLDGGSRLGRGVVSLAVALLLLPFSGRLRRSAKCLRGIAVCMFLLAAAGTMITLTGCGTSNGIFAQPQQTYVVTVTGTAGALSHATNVTLTVE